MKVLVSRGSAGGFGGAEISARDHAVMLKTAGHDPFFVTNLGRLRRALRDHEIPAAPSLWANRGTGPLRHLNFLICFPLMWAHYLILVWLHKPDLINPHSREDQVIFTLLKPLHKRPVVWKDPGDLRFLLRERRRNPLAKLNQRLLERALRRADFIYALNETDRDLIAKHAGKEKVTAIPSSMLFENYDLNASPMPHKHPVIGCISALEEHKGIQHLIAAAHQLLSEGRQLEFWIIGEGPFRPELERLAAEHPQIHFWGQQETVSPFYRTFTAFVQPAEHEAWGRTVKEAMYFGLPVVGSRSGGVGAQITHEDNGLLFTPSLPEDLAKQLRHLLDDPKFYERVAKRARKSALEAGDFSRIFTEQILPIFERFGRSKR